MGSAFPAGFPKNSPRAAGSPLPASLEYQKTAEKRRSASGQISFFCSVAMYVHPRRKQNSDCSNCFLLPRLIGIFAPPVIMIVLPLID